MRAARAAIGNYCCRKSVNQILYKCKWMTINNMIKHSSIITIHTIIVNRTPKALINLININNMRQSKEISTKYIPRTEKLKKFYFIQGLKLYNDIPSNFK